MRDLSASGSGVVEHPSGRVCFVPGVWIGEHGRFRLLSLRGRTGEAELLELLAPSPERQAAPCPHHGRGAHDCGGCPWQFMQYTAQLAAKQARVEGAMARLGLSDSVAPILASPETLGYRNRARLRSDGRELGFLAAGSNRLAAVQDCLVLNAHNRSTLRALRAQLPRREWALPRGALSVLAIDDEIDATQVEPGLRRPFRQGNTEQNQRMRAWLAAQLKEIDCASPALELFSGAGNFTGVLANAGFPRVHAVDSAGEAIESLRTLGLPGVSVQTLDLYATGALAHLGDVLPDAGTLLLDPPRDGLRELPALLSACPRLQYVFYISCDLASFSRDLGALLGAGFALHRLQPLDLFPHTPHVELMAALRRS